ncbi:MAG: maleylpyruvate isomerase N-terminal domain-containing protein [Catenulispora sp.]
MPRTATARSAATHVTPQKWTAVRAAMDEFGERFAALIESAPDASRPATEHWSAAETAAHVTSVACNYAALAAGEELPTPDMSRLMAMTTVDNLGTEANPAQLRSFTERDPERLAERLRTAIRELLAHTADADPGSLIDWLGGSRLPLAGALAHMVNEMHIHGRDIARGIGAPWRIPEDQAGLFFDLFLVEICRNGTGILLDDDRPVRPGRISVEFRSAYTAPATIVLTDGVVSAEEPRGDADVRIRFRPAALNLMLFHRVGVARTALSGAVVVTGRRPWLLPAFLRKVRMP